MRPLAARILVPGLLATAVLSIPHGLRIAGGQEPARSNDAANAEVTELRDGRPLGRFFLEETRRVTKSPLLGIESADEWKSRRPELQRQLREMLGLDPLPPRTDLKAEIRKTIDRPDFVVENLVFQSMPGLYVTANVYRPKSIEGRKPAVLYVCGHAQVVKDGVIYGNKAYYQHHGAWFAANGFVCLVVDTLQLGEVPGLHHGTYREGKWWWQSRGYTPAGVEVWNGIRAIDYLVSRPDVDPDRLGITGRSGGGAMSWYLGAVEDRLKVVVPVAGITDLHDHVIAGNTTVGQPDGVVEGHCDCMYTVNTYRWDYDTVAALVAPKAMMVQNTDVDPIFPEKGVRKIYESLESVYDWYNAPEKLDLLIGTGGHEDTKELRHAAFAWFERWLKGNPAEVADIEEPDRSIAVEELKVLDPGKPLPANANDTIDESFVPTTVAPSPPESPSSWEILKAGWMDQLESKVFAGWESTAGSDRIVVEEAYPVRVVEDDGTLHILAHDLHEADRPETKLRLWTFARAGSENDPVELRVLDAAGWERHAKLLDAVDAGRDPKGLPLYGELRDATRRGIRLILFAPRGIGPTAWPQEKDTHIRRRFALLGETLDGMRVLDVRHAIQTIEGDPGETQLKIQGEGEAAAWALWAAVFEPSVDEVALIDPPLSVRDGPAFLNLERILDMPQAAALLHPRALTIATSLPDAWAWTRALAENLGDDEPWPTIADRKAVSD